MIRHDWSLTPREAMGLQRELAAGVRIEPLEGPIETVAGTDCAFIDGGKAVVAAAVLCDARTLAVLAVATAVEECRMPYIPGLLSFREAPAVIAALEHLPHRPGLLLCDGQGLAHPRGFGLSCHVGLWLDIPAIGVAKSRLCGEHADPGPARGSRRRLLLDGRVVGAVLRTQASVRPLYISVGHRVTLEDAVRWTLRCAKRYRLPEPNRRAHHEVTMYKRR